VWVFGLRSGYVLGNFEFLRILVSCYFRVFLGGWLVV